MSATREHIREAVIAYYERRGQMGARKAAAHVMQEFGVTAADIGRAVAEDRLLYVKPSEADKPLESA
jgi:hypothetical protein